MGLMTHENERVRKQKHFCKQACAEMITFPLKRGHLYHKSHDQSVSTLTGDK